MGQTQGLLTDLLTKIKEFKTWQETIFYLKVMLLKDKIFLIIWLKWRLKPRENIERHKKENVTIAVEGLIKKCFN